MKYQITQVGSPVILEVCESSQELGQIIESLGLGSYNIDITNK